MAAVAVQCRIERIDKFQVGFTVGAALFESKIIFMNSVARHDGTSSPCGSGIQPNSCKRGRLWREDYLLKVQYCTVGWRLEVGGRRNGPGSQENGLANAI